MLTPAKQSENKAAEPTATNNSFFGKGNSMPFFQAKLTVSHPGNAHEREADAVADQVMRLREGDAPIVQRMPLTPVSSIQRACANCEKEKEGIQRKETGGSDASGKAAPSVVSDVLSSDGGQPMEASTRQFMESRFGQDFSQVRIHTDSRAAESASAIQARAYTSGQDVVFGGGEYQPSSGPGQRLLAHELVHVGQQRGVQRKVIQRDIIFGGGYRRPYTNDPSETRSAEAGTWTPSTTDFSASATASGGGQIAPNFAGFLTALSGKADGSIHELFLIGHANSGFFSFGGNILVQNPPDVDFVTEDNGITTGTIAQNLTTIASLRSKFAPNAAIILVGCHTGTGGSLLEAISRAFQVCVKGFRDEVKWCISWNTPRRDITSRGRMHYADRNDPLAGLIEIPCGSFTVSVSSLTPDNQSCVGVPVAPPSSTKK